MLNRVFTQSGFYLSLKLQTISEEKKDLAQFIRLAFQCAAHTRWNALSPCVTVYITSPSNTWQTKCSKNFHFSTTSLCKAFQKQADRSKADSFALLEEWLSRQQRQKRMSWFQIKAACCCRLRFYHRPLWLEHFLAGRIHGPCLWKTEFSAV